MFLLVYRIDRLLDKKGEGKDSEPAFITLLSVRMIEYENQSVIFIEQKYRTENVGIYFSIGKKILHS